MPLNQQLTDLGGIPVLWDSDLGTLVQDPTQGGTNRYGPGDLFRDPNSGDVYQLQQDGSLSLYRLSTPTPSVPAITAGVSSSGAVSSAGKSWTSSPTTSTTPAISTTGNFSSWLQQATRWLSRTSFISGVPNGLLVAGGALAYTYMRKRRRNPERPILRNPSGARVVYNRLLGGWYVVVGRHQSPISGRFDTKQEALDWLNGRRRNPGKRTRRLRGLMMRDWREATDPREYPSHQRRIQQSKASGDPRYFSARRRRRHSSRTAQLRELQGRGWYR